MVQGRKVAKEGTNGRFMLALSFPGMSVAPLRPTVVESNGCDNGPGVSLCRHEGTCRPCRGRERFSFGSWFQAESGRPGSRFHIKKGRMKIRPGSCSCWFAREEINWFVYLIFFRRFFACTLPALAAAARYCLAIMEFCSTPSA